MEGGPVRENGTGVNKSKKFPILFVALIFLMGWGCASSFSFSWHTEKDVERIPGSRGWGGFQGKGLTSRGIRTAMGTPSPLEIQGVQITRLYCTSPTGLDSFMKRLKRAGIGTVYFRVFQNPGDAFFRIFPPKARVGVYFETTKAPVVSNLLPLVCRAAHRYGIQVYAWMNTLKASFMFRGARLGHVEAYDLATGRAVGTSRLSPFAPKVVPALCALFTDLARTPVDGILIQDDLVLRYNEDVSPWAIQMFKRETGVKDISPARFYVLGKEGSHGVQLKGYKGIFWRWAAWKNRKLALVLKRLIQATKSVAPTLKIALNIHYESLLMPEDALAWYSRDVPTLEKIAHPDQYAVMSYQNQMARELEKSEAQVYRDLKTMVKTAVTLVPDPSRWVFKVQTIDYKTRRPIEMRQILHAVASIESASPVHVCLMPYAPFLFAKYGHPNLQIWKPHSQKESPRLKTSRN